MTSSIKWNIVDFTENNILAGMISCALWGWGLGQMWKLFVQKSNTSAFDKIILLSANTASFPLVYIRLHSMQQIWYMVCIGKQNHHHTELFGSL